MEIVSNILTKNDCYRAGRTISPSGIVVHDTGCNQKKISRYTSSWNTSGVEKCVHAFVGLDDNDNVTVVQTLPWNWRCWGCGSGKNGSYNSSHIQFEICEDDLTDADYFAKVYSKAVELCAYLCRLYSIPVGKIVDHAEAHALGYASNHSDTTDWFPKFGKSMDTFRSDVQNAMNGGSVSVEVKPSTPSATTSNKKAEYQTWLNSNYKTGLSVDGLWGPKTKKASVKALQTELNDQFNAKLNVDGIWGPKTKAACVNVKRGANGNITRIVQGTLYCFGYDPKGFDGIFGSGCESAVKKYQTSKGLTSDGVVGKNTFKSMFS